MLYFFLSYARGDDDDFVKKFYGDLCSELRTHAGVRGTNEQIGFFDTSSIGMGQAWGPQLVEALSTCQLLLFLCTPAYFGSEPCGKEYQVFADRLAEYRRSTGRTAPALFPILWLPMSEDRMPVPVSNLQNHTDRLGDPYRRRGLRQLMRLPSNQEAYVEFLYELAELIIDTATNHPIPPCTAKVAFQDVTSAFHQEKRGEQMAGGMTVTGATAAQHVHFVVVAPSWAEIAGLRQKPIFYGRRSVDWAPYQPDFPLPLGPYALGIAAGHRFQAEVATIDGLPERMNRAMRNNQVVILLVDAWATRLTSYREALVQYSEQEQHLDEQQVTAVMIPWNHTDEETQQHGSELRSAIQSVFYRRTASGGDVMYRTSIPTRDAFDANLSMVLEVAKNHMFVRGRVFRRPAGEGRNERPNLNGP